MHRRPLTREQLIQLFETAEAAQPTPLLAMAIQHLHDKNTETASASITRALQESRGKEPPLSLPSEVLPPLV